LTYTTTWTTGTSDITGTSDTISSDIYITTDATTTTDFTTSDTGYYYAPVVSTEAYYFGQDKLKLPTYDEFDSDYMQDTQDTEDPLKIMKRLARGCYKGNSCVKCNNKRIEIAYLEKYQVIPINYSTSLNTTVDYTIELVNAPTLAYTSGE